MREGQDCVRLRKVWIFRSYQSGNQKLPKR